MPSAYLSRAGFAANHKPRFKLDLAVPAGISAKGPFDDGTNKSVIKLLPRKPPAIKQRPGDRRREIGYIEIRAQLAARLCPRRNRAEPRHHTSMSARLKLGDLLVALGGVNDRGHRGRPPTCLQAFSKLAISALIAVVGPGLTGLAAVYSATRQSTTAFQVAQYNGEIAANLALMKQSADAELALMKANIDAALAQLKGNSDE
jgi:hypothetical protein